MTSRLGLANKLSAVTGGDVGISLNHPRVERLHAHILFSHHAPALLHSARRTCLPHLPAVHIHLTLLAAAYYASYAHLFAHHAHLFHTHTLQRTKISGGRISVMAADVSRAIST